MPNIRSIYFIIIFFCNIFIGQSYEFLDGKRSLITNSGLLFTKTNDVVITGDSWTIVLGLNVNHHLYEAMKLRNWITSLQHEPDINEIELDRLISVTDELVSVNEALTAMLKHKRRGKRLFDNQADYKTEIVFNFGSNIDATDLENTKDSLSNLKVDHAIQKHLLADHISYSKILDTKVEENTKRIYNLTEDVKNEIKNINQTLTKLTSSYISLQKKIDAASNLSSMFRLLQTEGVHSLIAASRLQQALEMAAEGKLSFYLISPKELQNELITITSLLPFGLKLFGGLGMDDMYRHKDMAKVAVMANSVQIFITIQFPLLSSTSGFNLYSVSTLPIYNTDLEAVIKVEPEGEHMIVSDDMQHYALPSSSYLAKCHGKQPMICPADITLLNRAISTCIGASYFDNVQQIGEACNKKIVLSGEKPYWISERAIHGWIYSLTEPINITLHCGEKLAKRVNLNSGIGQLINTSHCSIYGDSFKLLRTQYGGVSYRMNSKETMILTPTNTNTRPPIFSSEEIAIISTDIEKIKTNLNIMKNNKRIKKDVSRFVEIPLELVMEPNNTQFGANQALGHHHHVKIDSINGVVLVVVCIVASTVASLVSVGVLLYLFAGRICRYFGYTKSISSNGVPPRDIAGDHATLIRTSR